EVSAVLTGPLETPNILHGPTGKRSADYLAQLAEDTLQTERISTAEPLSKPTKFTIERSGTTVGGEGQAAFFTVFALFMVSLMLAGQVVGTMAEERSNKVIEILAAAVPLESVFFGKL